MRPSTCLGTWHASRHACNLRPFIIDHSSPHLRFGLVNHDDPFMLVSYDYISEVVKCFPTCVGSNMRSDDDVRKWFRPEVSKRVSFNPDIYRRHFESILTGCCQIFPVVM